METRKLNRINRFLYNPKLSGIAICVLCLGGMIIARFLEEWFRFSDYHRVYKYGSLLSKNLVFLMVGCSFLHPIVVISEKGKQWVKHWIWILIGLLPFLYFGISMTIAMSRTIE